jgi:hypothetical protein
MEFYSRGEDLFIAVGKDPVFGSTTLVPHNHDGVGFRVEEHELDRKYTKVYGDICMLPLKRITLLCKDEFWKKKWLTCNTAVKSAAVSKVTSKIHEILNIQTAVINNAGGTNRVTVSDIELNPYPHIAHDEFYLYPSCSFHRQMQVKFSIKSYDKIAEKARKALETTLELNVRGNGIEKHCMTMELSGWCRDKIDPNTAIDCTGSITLNPPDTEAKVVWLIEEDDVVQPAVVTEAGPSGKTPQQHAQTSGPTTHGSDDYTLTDLINGCPWLSPIKTTQTAKTFAGIMVKRLRNLGTSDDEIFNFFCGPDIEFYKQKLRPERQNAFTEYNLNWNLPELLQLAECWKGITYEQLVMVCDIWLSQFHGGVIIQTERANLLSFLPPKKSGISAFAGWFYEDNIQTARAESIARQEEMRAVETAAAIEKAKKAAAEAEEAVQYLKAANAHA